MVGCALGPARLWFTIGQGILNEVYYPRADVPQIRDMGFIVADGRGFWCEIKNLPGPELVLAEPGVPAIEILHRHDRFVLRQRICPDPLRDVLLLELFLDGEPELRPYVMLAPHLGGAGIGNNAWATVHRGRRVLWAEQGPFGLALAASDAQQVDAFTRISAGYVGASDGWQDFAGGGSMRWEYGHAGPGNVALTAELPAWCLLALGFGSSKESAATLAASALMQRYDDVVRHQVAQWHAWHGGCESRRAVSPLLPDHLQNQLLTSAMVLRAHQDKTYPGAMVASLSIPWGELGGERACYHLVRPRDLVECAQALLTLGALEEARDILRYLIATQNHDGSWYASQWLGGKPQGEAKCLSDAAFPVLLASALAERGALEGTEAEEMVRRALAFIIGGGPAGQDGNGSLRGRVPAFALGMCVAALVTGARFLGPRARTFALALADFWNSRLETWSALHGTPLCRRLEVAGYFVGEPAKGEPPAGEGPISLDFLHLVRFGLRRPDDPLVLDSIKVADALLKTELPQGPGWLRHLSDEYGEHSDGRAFDGSGRGRAWPLRNGERGHYELATGRDPLALLEAMAAMAGPLGMLPEQVWDAPAIPCAGLYPGRPTGSAMPLGWSHAEFIKLAVSRETGRPVDRPTSVWRRYQARERGPDHALWFMHAPIEHLRPQQIPVICLPRPARIHYGLDGWHRVADTETYPTGLGIYAAELPLEGLGPGRVVDFTVQWRTSGQWLGRDFRLRVGAPASPSA